MPPFEPLDLGPCRGRLWSGDPDRVVVLLPGAWYPPAAPHLWFTHEVARGQGRTVLEVWDEWDESDWVPWVERRTRAALAAVQADRTALVGKSLSSAAASIAAEDRLPAVWLTPLLTEPHVRDALERATAPTLLVGGTADPMWDAGVARAIDAEVLELDGADHRLHVGDDLETSARLLGEVATAVDRFLAESA
jgi:pimeloyl-ACP methyl ester carboxylesterase